jgi:benzoyl-CoA reductase/2-hydroxyglutaryl-CoA dehydratase subunit BcrC/BadD/HgdB
MADMICCRNQPEVGEAFKELIVELEENVKNGESTLPFPENYRIMLEGIPCWPHLKALFKPLKEYGLNVTAVVYAPAFGFEYKNMDEMCQVYAKTAGAVCIEEGTAWREQLCRENKVDGILVHYNRSCKAWSGYMAEMQRRWQNNLGVPAVSFDGDQADPRNFTAANYETRVQGLVEAMAAAKARKEAESK